MMSGVSTPALLERAVEVGIVLLPAVPFARMAVEPGVRRRFRAFPRVQGVLVGSLVAYAAATVLIAVTSPWLLRAAAAAALLVVAVERWQARPGYGARRRLPPGSLGLATLAAWRDPEFYARQAERHGPIFKYRHFVHPAVGVVGLERGVDLLRSQSAHLAVPPAPFTTLVPGGFVRYVDSGAHRSLAPVIRSIMSRRVVEACAADIAEAAREALVTLAASPAGVDPRPTLDRMSLCSLMRAFYGLRPGPLFDRLEELYAVADYRRLARTGREKAASALMEAVGEVRELDTSETAAPSFVGELERLHPELLGDDLTMANIVYTLHTARFDVDGLLVWLVRRIGIHPEWLRRLAAELPDSPGDSPQAGGTADRFVRETLRLEQSEFVLRRATGPIGWHGYEIPAGWWVRVCVRESHRSPEAFEDPGRFLEEPGRAHYAPFGLYTRLCPGELLARSIGMHLLHELASGYEVSVIEDGPPEFSGFHWQPSDRFRVRVSEAPRPPRHTELATPLATG
jgi:cytochrome P450